MSPGSHRKVICRVEQFDFPLERQSPRPIGRNDFEIDSSGRQIALLDQFQLGELRKCRLIIPAFLQFVCPVTKVLNRSGTQFRPFLVAAGLKDSMTAVRPLQIPDRFPANTPRSPDRVANQITGIVDAFQLSPEKVAGASNDLPGPLNAFFLRTGKSDRPQKSGLHFPRFVPVGTRPPYPFRPAGEHFARHFTRKLSLKLIGIGSDANGERR